MTEPIAPTPEQLALAAALDAEVKRIHAALCANGIILTARPALAIMLISLR